MVTTTCPRAGAPVPECDAAAIVREHLPAFLAMDGAFLDVGGGSVRWLAAPPPSDADLDDDDGIELRRGRPRRAC